MLTRCNDCKKKISSNATVCVHCGNPFVKSGYKFYSDLSMYDKKCLKKEFARKIKLKLKPKKLIFLIISGLGSLVFCIATYATLLKPLIVNWTFWTFLVFYVSFIIGFCFDKDIREREIKFNTWLEKEKHIKK